MLSINTNLSSIIAQESMKQSTNKLNQAIERMTTGAKINHASDNAANYSISTNMTTKISSYKVAEDNAAMGLDMLNTASDTISEMQSHGERLRALATQARNGTYGKQSLEAIQAEANAIYDEINRIYSTAKYNGISLFNQSEYDIPDNMPQADPITGFIEDPYDYTEEDLKNIESISKVTDSFTESEYKVETVADLAKLAKLTNDGVDTTGVTFVLANDLDLKEYCEEHNDEGGWTPIGNETNTFKGNFNGNGHIISNLTINRPTENKQGLFGQSFQGSIIENIGLNNSSIIGKENAAILVGQSFSNIINCFSMGDVVGTNNVALLAGFSQSNSFVKSSYVEGSVIASSDWVGGLVGSCWANVSDCYAIAEVSSNTSCVGGLVGYLATNRKIENSYSKGSVSGYTSVGGLIGLLNFSSGTNYVHNCISFSTVASKSSASSFIGAINVNNSSITAGISINNCKVIASNINKMSVKQDSLLLPDYDTSAWEAEIEEIKLKDISTNLQVGIKGESTSQLSVDTNFEHNLGKIVRNGIGSDSALSTIDDFVNLLSDKQTELGAAQNRLESALDEIATQYENLVSARSTLRDADMAEVSSTYIQQQILQQASATLMATANQSPAIALQLI